LNDVIDQLSSVFMEAIASMKDETGYWL